MFGSVLRLSISLRWLSRVVAGSVELSQSLVSSLFGKRDRERVHGGEENGLMRS